MSSVEAASKHADTAAEQGLAPGYVMLRVHLRCNSLAVELTQTSPKASLVYASTTGLEAALDSLAGGGMVRLECVCGCECACVGSCGIVWLEGCVLCSIIQIGAA